MWVFAVTSPHGIIVKLFDSAEKAYSFIDNNTSAYIRDEHTVEVWEVE